jgi:hypothetical protein
VRPPGLDANNKWVGYGDATLAYASRRWTTRTRTALPPVRAAGGANNTTTSAFQRVDLNIANRATATFSATDRRPGASRSHGPSTRR